MWKPAWCNGKALFVLCDGSGNPQPNERGLMVTRYQNKDGAKEYSAAQRNVSFEAPPKSKAEQLSTVETKKPPPGPSRWTPGSKGGGGGGSKEAKPKAKAPPKKRQRLDEAGAAAAMPLPSDGVFLAQAQKLLAGLDSTPVWFVLGNEGVFRVATSNAAGGDWKEHQESTGAGASANLSELMAIEKALEFSGGVQTVAIITTKSWAYQVCRSVRSPLLPQTQAVAARIRKVLQTTGSNVHWIQPLDKIEGVRRCMAFSGGGKKRKAEST